MSIKEMVMDKYPVLFDESQCATLKRQRDGLRENYRKRLESGLTFETKEHEPVISEPKRDWFGNIIELKQVYDGEYTTVGKLPVDPFDNNEQ